MPRRFPDVAQLVASPATAGLAAMAIVVTGLGWAGYDVSPLAMDGEVLLIRPWTLFTSALPHGDVLHLVFNVYWLCLLGVHVEKELGSVVTFVVYVLWSVASAAGEHALFEGGIGLSGIVYGIAAYGWVRGRATPAWTEIVDTRTAQLFALWFVFCVVATYTDTMPVANVAHGVGAVMGGLTALVRSPGRAAIGVAGTALVLAAAVGLDLPDVRARVNLSGGPARAAEERGLAALAADDVEGAIAELELASSGSTEARTFHNLGVAYDRAGRGADACAAYERAEALVPGTETADLILFCQAY